jgi:excisionase family DNA binding protein
MKTLSTPEVAKLVGIHQITLERWLAAEKIPSPKKLRTGRRIVRLWTNRDVERIRKYKQENYRKGRGRKPKTTRGK